MKIKQLYILAAFLMLSFSCGKILDKNPTDAISSATFWNTDADAKMALAGCYNKLYSCWSLTYNRCYLDCLTDNAFGQWGGASYNMDVMSTGNLTPSTNGVNYGSYYRAIAGFNYFLGNIDKVQAIDPDQKNVYVGEAKFLRALAYFDLVNFYGDVIYYKESPATADEAKVAQSPKEEVLTFVKEDLDFGIANLPNTAYAGHAVKGSALALKARVLLYEKKWAEAAAAAKQVIDDGKFSLGGNYEGLFLTPGQANNPEIMFSTVYTSPDLPQQITEGRASNTQFGWGSHIDPYYDLVDAYECNDGKSITESPLYDATKPWLNRDPRLKMTIRLPNVTWPAGEPAGAPSLTGINMQKYVDLSQAPFSGGFNSAYDQDYVHIRYADVLLMYAEAQNEAEGPSTGVYDALDKVRARPGVAMPPVDRVKYSSQAGLRDYIRHERRIELALEGQRYFDLKRWHIADVVLPKIKTPGGLPLVFIENYYVLPFPQSEIDINPALKQNPGY
ncbi:MAG: RagB/SusD family nutrient uptake outer membrane protein [Ferruginibacter sp.]